MTLVPASSSTGAGGAISGVTITGVAAAGQVPVASSATAGAWAYPPGFQFGYDQITAPVTIVSTTESAGTVIIACGAHTFDGGAVICQFFAPDSPTGSAGSFIVSLFEASAQLGRLYNYASNIVGTVQIGLNGWFRFTPSAGSHTYTITASASQANVNLITAGVGGTGAYVPAFVRFTKV